MLIALERDKIDEYTM